MGPVGKSAVQAVFGAVAFRVRLVDADSSFVVAQVVPAFSVPRGPVQERAPATWKWGWSLTRPCSLGSQPPPFPCDWPGRRWWVKEAGSDEPRSITEPPPRQSVP